MCDAKWMGFKKRKQPKVNINCKTFTTFCRDSLAVFCCVHCPCRNYQFHSSNLLLCVKHAQCTEQSEHLNIIFVCHCLFLYSVSLLRYCSLNCWLACLHFHICIGHTLQYYDSEYRARNAFCHLNFHVLKLSSESERKSSWNKFCWSNCWTCDAHNVIGRLICQSFFWQHSQD